jgi:hypothetical protein
MPHICDLVEILLTDFSVLTSLSIVLGLEFNEFPIYGMFLIDCKVLQILNLTSSFDQNVQIIQRDVTCREPVQRKRKM